LSHVKQLLFRLEPISGGELEVRLDKPDGALIGTIQVPPSLAKDPNPWKELKVKILEKEGIFDVYFVFKSKTDKQQNLFHLDWIYFSNEHK